MCSFDTIWVHWREGSVKGGKALDTKGYNLPDNWLVMTDRRLPLNMATGHWLDTHVAPWYRRLAEVVFSWSWLLLAVITPSLYLSLSWFLRTCFKNNHSTSMSADISTLQLVLQLLTLKSFSLFCVCMVLVFPYPLKVPGDYCLIIWTGGR